MLSMKIIKNIVLPCMGMLLCFESAQAQVDEQKLINIIDAEFRTNISRSRDQYRNPLETLSFFGVEPDMTVVELWPGGGWYTDILAPYLKEEGKYIAAHYNPETEGQLASYFQSSYLAFESRIASEPYWYGKMEIHPFEPPQTQPIAPSGSVDMVVTFRNVHHWLNNGTFENIMKEAWTVLKPGGVFCVVDNRANVYENADPLAESGYVNQQWLVQQIHDAGFQVLEHSEVNANPQDSADHPNGVWTLLPYLRVPEGEEEQRYVDIGETDRFTMKFIKLGQ